MKREVRYRKGNEKIPEMLVKNTGKLQVTSSMADSERRLEEGHKAAIRS